MSVVSVRLEEADEKWLRKRGLKPGTFARLAVHEAIRRQEIKEASEFLAKHRVKVEGSLVDFIREDREHGH